MVSMRRTSYCRGWRSQLFCESLEERALLAGMIATVELPPQSAIEVAAETRAFIESALNNALAARAYEPLEATVTVEEGHNEVGRAAKITNLTFNLIEADTAVEIRTTPVATQDSLIFTFYVYEDQSVSLRARLLSAVDVGLPMIAAGDSSEAVDSLPTAGSDGDWLMTWENGLSNVEPPTAVACVAGKPMGGQDDRLNGSPTQPHNVYGPLPQWSSESGEDGTTPQGPQADIGQAETEGMLFMGNNPSDSGEPADSSASDCQRDAAPASADSGPVRSENDLTSPEVPLPSGMVAIDYQPQTRTAGKLAAGNAVEPAAIFQVFIHSAAHTPAATATATTRTLPAKTWIASGTSTSPRESHSIRYASVAAVSLACGYWLTTHVGQASASLASDTPAASASRAAASPAGISATNPQGSTVSLSASGHSPLPAASVSGHGAAVYAAASQFARRVGAMFKRRASFM